MNSRNSDKSGMSAYTRWETTKGCVPDEYVDMSEAVARAGDLRQDGTEPEDYPDQEVF